MERGNLSLKLRLDALWTYAHGLLPESSALPPFFIFGQGRSGSTLLCNLLNSHPDVFCEGEILYHPRFAPVTYALGRKTLALQTKMYGFKVKIYQLENVQGYDTAETFVRNLANRGWRLIYLWRRDVFRQCVSARIAWRKDLWHADEKAQDQVDESVRLDPEKLVADVQARVRWLEQERAIVEPLRAHTVNYEDDLSAASVQQSTLSGLFDFLGIPDAPVSTSLRKTSKPNLRSQIKNYDEIQDYFVQNGLGKYL